MAIPRSRYCHLFPCVLVLVPIMVHILVTILQGFIFGYLISFISPIFPNWDLVNNINNDVIYLRHLQNLIYLYISTQTPLIEYLNYLRYLQQILKSLFVHCNLIVLFKRLYTWNLIEICKSVHWKNVWESCRQIGKVN